METAAPLLVALLLAAAVGYAAYRKLRRDAAELPQRLDLRDDGLVTIREPAGWLKLLGEGPNAAGPLALAPGSYRLDYEFADDVPTRIYLRAGDPAGERLLIETTGAGWLVFEAHPSLYLRVDTEPEIPWALALRLDTSDPFASGSQTG